MSRLLEPFSGYLPTSDQAHRIVGPPVSTLSPEQRAAARLDPLSFRHVVGRGAGSSNSEAKKWLRAGRIKPHEATIAKTEKKMARYMRTTRIYGNPVALAHRPHPSVDAAIATRLDRPADYSFVSADGFSHALWAINGDAAEELCASFDATLYITDGHHRLAAASSVAIREHRPDPHLPAGLFATNELRLATFARCVVDPDLDAAAVIDRLRAEHEVAEVSPAEARPTGRHEFGVRLPSGSYRLRIDPALAPDDLYHSLDVNLLQDLILEPVFGIKTPRKDRRLHFSPNLPDSRLTPESCAAWFLPFPVSVDDVMAIADAGLSMPPKSTRFGPKLPSGLAIRLLDKRRS